MSAEWAEVYSALFNRRLSDADVHGFELVIMERIPNPVKGEVKAACMILGRDWQTRTKDGGYAAPPTASDILRHMVRSRNEMLHSRHSACDHCNDGWMSFRLVPQADGELTIHGVTGTVVHPNDEAGGMPMACPCKCSRGDSHVSTCKTQASLVHRLRDAVMAARVAYLEFRTTVRPGAAQTDVGRLAEGLARRLKQNGG